MGAPPSPHRLYIWDLESDFPRTAVLPAALSLSSRELCPLPRWSSTERNGVCTWREAETGAPFTHPCICALSRPFLQACAVSGDTEVV